MNGDKKGIDEIVKFLKAGPLDPAVGKVTIVKVETIFFLITEIYNSVFFFSNRSCCWCAGNLFRIYKKSAPIKRCSICPELLQSSKRSIYWYVLMYSLLSLPLNV